MSCRRGRRGEDNDQRRRRRLVSRWHHRQRSGRQSCWKRKCLRACKEMYPVPVERVVLQTHKTQVELLDEQLLKDCPVFDFPYNEVDAYLKPPPQLVVLKLTVLPVNSKEKIEIILSSVLAGYTKGLHQHEEPNKCMWVTPTAPRRNTHACIIITDP